MPRTIFPHAAVNKPLNLANTNSIHIDGIKSYFIKNIDRIQLSVDSRCYYYIREYLKSYFERDWKKRKVKRSIKQYNIHNSKVHLVKYSRQLDYSTMWFSIGIQDPTRRSLETIKNIIDNALKSANLTWERVSLTQAEFASDFSTQKPEEQEKLFDLLKHSVVLKYSRSNSYSKFKTTTYQGKDGNVRKGTKGLRYYPKKIDGNNYLRIELHANRIFISSRKITLTNIFDFLETFSLLHYVDFYKCIDTNKVSDIISRIISKKRPNFINNSNFAQRVYTTAVLNYVTNGIYEDGNEQMGGTTLPVAMQMDYVKNIHSKNGLTYHKDRLFTHMEISHTV